MPRLAGWSVSGATFLLSLVYLGTHSLGLLQLVKSKPSVLPHPELSSTVFNINSTELGSIVFLHCLYCTSPIQLDLYNVIN